MNSNNPDIINQELFSRLADILQDDHSLAYAFITPSLSIRWSSPGFENLLPDPATRTDISNRLLPDLLWEFAGLEDELQAILQGKSKDLRIERINRQTQDQTTSYLNFKVVPYNEGNPGQGLLLVIEDNTATGNLEQQLVQERNELRLAQAELERLNRLKSMFLSIAAHDIRAPLTAIAGYASLIQSGLSTALSERDEGFFSEIRVQVDQLNRLVEDFLQLDRLERGQLVIHPVACDLNQAIQRVVSLLHEAASLKYQTIETGLEGEKNLVLADPGRLDQILYNLLSNAIKYTPQGGSISICAWAQEDWGVFSIEDSGTGMAENELAHLFELYYRTEQVQRSRASGTGLGLYIVKSLVDSHQGQIKVSSQPGAGTTFTAYLPAFDQGG